MNKFKYLSTCLIGATALLIGASPASAQGVTLGAASAFTVLGGTAVSCTASGIAGDVGSTGAYSPVGCAITGQVPPATNAAATAAQAALQTAYGSLLPQNCDTAHTLLSTITGPMTLSPGTYCTGAALTGAGVLTLDAGGDPNAVWIFKIGAALTGTGFSVVMANGGQPCNVFWVPGTGVTMTGSAFSGNILAGGAAGSITLNGGSLAGRALANVAVTMTAANVVGCSALPGAPTSCKPEKGDGHDGHKGDKDHHDDDGHNGDKDHHADKDKDRGNKNPFGDFDGKKRD